MSSTVQAGRAGAADAPAAGALVALAGEPPEIYPFLGSYLLAEAIDCADVDLAVHGHAHLGTEKGVTPGGVRVRNVALPVIQHAYAVYCLDGERAEAGCPSSAEHVATG